MSCRPPAEPRIPRERKAKRLDWFVLRCVKIPIFLRTAPCGVPLVVFCTRTALRRVTCTPPPPSRGLHHSPNRTETPPRVGLTWALFSQTGHSTRRLHCIVTPLLVIGQRGGGANGFGLPCFELGTGSTPHAACQRREPPMLHSVAHAVGVIDSQAQRHKKKKKAAAFRNGDTLFLTPRNSPRRRMLRLLDGP